jgi:branched-chain amino acid transport system substrate-binding protein
LGNEQIRGLVLAMDAIQNSILGHSLLIQTEDSGCTEEGGANAVLKIIADPKIVSIFGTTCSGAGKSAAHAMSVAGFTMISGNNSAPFLTSINRQKAPNWNDGYFRTSRNEENAGKTAAVFARKQLKAATAAVVNDGDIYTTGLTSGFSEEFKRLGGTIVLETSVAKGENQMVPVLTAVIQSKAELLFFPLFQPEGNYLLTQARSLPGMNGIILMSDGALIESSFITEMKDTVKGLYFVGPTLPDHDRAAVLNDAYLKKFNTPPSTPYYLFGYDAARLLFSAIETCAVRDKDGTLHIGRHALRKTLYATKDVKGVTGTLTCDEFGDCADPSFTILRLDDPAEGIAGLLKNVLFRYTFDRKSGQERTGNP